MLSTHRHLALYIGIMFSTTVSAKLLIPIEFILINTRARAKINNKYTEKFKLESGVQQGNPPSATLYSVVVDVIFKQLDLRGNISKVSKCSAYGDYILITTRTQQSFTGTFQKLKINWYILD